MCRLCASACGSSGTKVSLLSIFDMKSLRRFSTAGGCVLLLIFPPGNSDRCPDKV